MIDGFIKLYHDLGLNIMPLKPKSKYPALNEWKKYQKEKYTGEFKPNENGAVICGETSGGLILVDLDNQELCKVFDDWEKIKKETLVVETGKGYHVYVKPKTKPPETSIRTTNEKGQHIDIQCQGTYGLMAGSIHPDTGKEYKIISSTLNIEPLDIDGFISGLSKHGFNIENKRKGMVDLLKGVEKGERDMSVFRVAMGFRHAWGYKESELLFLCRHYNQQYVFPPLPDVVIKQKVQSAIRYDIDKIRFKEILEESDVKEIKLKYDDDFWKDVEDLRIHNNLQFKDLKLKCIICNRLMTYDPQDTAHKGHIITVIYK